MSLYTYLPVEPKRRHYYVMLIKVYRTNTPSEAQSCWFIFVHISWIIIQYVKLTLIYYIHASQITTIIHYIKLTDPGHLPFITGLPKRGPLYSGQVVNPRHKHRMDNQSHCLKHSLPTGSKQFSDSPTDDSTIPVVWVITDKLAKIDLNWIWIAFEYWLSRATECDM